MNTSDAQSIVFSKSTGYLGVELKVTRYFSPVLECRVSQFYFTGRHIVRYTKMTRYALLLAFTIIASTGSVLLREAKAAPVYTLTPIPGLIQEGYTVNLILTVYGATAGLPYEFFFHVRDPSSAIHDSTAQDITPIYSSFQVILTYPSSSLSGTNSIVGQYIAWVNQTKPISFSTAVASNSFNIILTDKFEYQRTETVSIRASGYAAAEPTTVTIRTFTPPTTVVFSQPVSASSSGIVTTSWKIPKNATIDSYTVSVTGTITTKSPADLQGFSVKAAVMSIASLTSSSSSYQRTQTMKFSFRPLYPSGENATTGAGILTLTRPDRTNITLTASYDGATQTFSATYKTFLDNQTGTWTASLPKNGYGDGYGNLGPNVILTTSPQLQPATFSFTITANSYFLAGHPVRFNATIQYPDGTNLQSGQVFAFLSYSGGGFNDSMSVVFDTTVRLWEGTYTPQIYEPGGLWSLIVKASDSPSVPPPNSGSATKAVTLQDRPPTASFIKSSSTALTGVQITFNATTSSDIDGTVVSYAWNFGDGSSGSGEVVTHSFSVAGSYTVTLTVTDNGGLTNSNTSVLTIQAPTSSSSGNVSFPLYYFGILAALIAALLAGTFLAFRRHKVTHAKLKIDLEAVKSEAGRIENQEFFQSVKDQLKKDKDD